MSDSRVALQLQRPMVLRRHVRRALLRVTALLGADVGAFLFVQFVVRGVVQGQWFGAAIASVVGRLTPASLPTGWEFGLALFVGLVATGSYGSGDDRRAAGRLGSAAALGTALMVFHELWTVGPGITVSSFAATAVLLSVVLIGARVAVDAVFQAARLGAEWPSRTLLVGTWEQCEGARHSPAFTRASGHEVIGFVTVDLQVPTDAVVLGGIEELRRAMSEADVETIVVCGELDERDFQTVVQAAHDAGVELLSVPRPFSTTGVEPRLVWRRGQPLIELSSPTQTWGEQGFKRAVDIAGALIGLTLLSPLFLVVAVAIKVNSPGPLFYRSPRWGRYGSRIGIWKFRTMVVDAAALLESDPKLKELFSANAKIDDDPRITRVGRLLRRWSVDELPQLWNVLVGELSLVGPRPKLFGEEDKYGAALATVLSVRPGLTGLWQVSGRNETTYDERVALDVRYASNPSLWEDIRILWATIPAVVRGTGAH